LLPFHDARQLLDAAVSTPAAVWPRLAVTAAYAAALAVVSWIAWRARAAAAPGPLITGRACRARGAGLARRPTPGRGGPTARAAPGRGPGRPARPCGVRSQPGRR